jgi:hypothetical protein
LRFHGADAGREGLIYYSLVGEVPGLGQVRQDVDGTFRMGRSLVKTHEELFLGVCGDRLRNVALLSAAQCNQTLQTWLGLAEELFPWLVDASWRLGRGDLAFDRYVGNCSAVIDAVRGGVRPTRKGSSWFEVGGEKCGVMWRGDKVAHRLYDKGLESGVSEYRGMLRSEEQLRHGSAGLGRVLSDRTFSREAVIAELNRRYEGVAPVGIGLAELVSGDDRASWRLATFCLEPGLMKQWGKSVSRCTYQRVKKQVREVLAGQSVVDLRVPEDAYLVDRVGIGGEQDE